MSEQTVSAVSADQPTALDARTFFAMLAGFCASLVAIGLARFAYTPLIPPLIEAHWFTSSQAVTLGAANFAGYFAGALFGRAIAHALTNRHALRLLMAIATVAFFACAFPLSIAWFFAWRFLSGLSGGAIMVLVATTILPHVPPARRGFASGMIFVGLGFGIAASGTLIPKLLHHGLHDTWMGLGVFSLILTAIAWFGWPASNPPAVAKQDAATHSNTHGNTRLRLLYGQYAANALGLVPVMILLVDCIARGYGRGAEVGASYWVLYGVAAIFGPLVCGNAGDRIGFGMAYRFALLVQACAVALLALSANPYVIGVATVALGISTTGIVPLALGRVHELLPHDHTEQRAAWSRATSAFALCQALAGYGYSFLFSHTHNDYALIFACGTCALAVAFIADIVVNRKRAAS
ncbi:YbfB/YjiJ family MFS transporter [Caballeronia sp. ATUFL_F1_KS4A]|uniref:YbfB/YjiJ family MFS transporter n=1 Tax=Caballeronia sp. ATUFL_F1_KS4A TaxID=2921768 RepID=UPI00202853B0|nr:YbfB/YjiJ family MFS transporter [Caballeronia sp. ATUFL_F1_KS4A]